jgi:hypothetical protein
MADPVGGWLSLPTQGRSAEFAKGDRRELEDGKHAHPSSTTGTFTDKNCPLCGSK